jgi:hypothetical protein
MLQPVLEIIAAQIVLLLIFRPLILWYFRLNRITKTLESIDLSLKQLPAVQAYQAKISQAGRRVA